MGYSASFGFWSVGAVHHEHLVCNPSCHHVIDNWEGAEADARSTFTGRGNTASITNYTLANAGLYQNVYNDGNATMVVLKQQNNSPDFRITLEPNTLAMVPGGTSTSTIHLLASKGFSGNITLAESVTPASGVSCSISPTIILVAPFGLSALSCSAVAVGSYNTTVTATSVVGGSIITHESTASISVSQPGSTFQMSVSSPSRVETGELAKSTITVRFVNGFIGVVNLSAVASSNLYCGDITPNKIDNSANATFSCSSIVPGTYDVRIQASSGSIVRTQIISITVNPPSSGGNVSGSFLFGLPPLLLYNSIGVAVLALFWAVLRKKPSPRVRPIKC
jgi:hypothetical protein